MPTFEKWVVHCGSQFISRIIFIYYIYYNSNIFIHLFCDSEFVYQKNLTIRTFFPHNSEFISHNSNISHKSEFISQNSAFFLVILSLYLTILTFILWTFRCVFIHLSLWFTADFSSACRFYFGNLVLNKQSTRFIIQAVLKNIQKKSLKII